MSGQRSVGGVSVRAELVVHRVGCERGQDFGGGDEWWECRSPEQGGGEGGGGCGHWFRGSAVLCAGIADGPAQPPME